MVSKSQRTVKNMSEMVLLRGFLTDLEKAKQTKARSKKPVPRTWSVLRLTESHTRTWGASCCQENKHTNMGTTPGEVQYIISMMQCEAESTELTWLRVNVCHLLSWVNIISYSDKMTVSLTYFPIWRGARHLPGCYGDFIGVDGQAGEKEDVKTDMKPVKSLSTSKGVPE